MDNIFSPGNRMEGEIKPKIFKLRSPAITNAKFEQNLDVSEMVRLQRAESTLRPNYIESIKFSLLRRSYLQTDLIMDGTKKKETFPYVPLVQRLLFWARRSTFSKKHTWWFHQVVDETPPSSSRSWPIWAECHQSLIIRAPKRWRHPGASLYLHLWSNG